MVEIMTPEGLRRMPQVFRLVEIHREALPTRGYRLQAVLFHEAAALSVRWTVSQPDTRLQPGALVSIRYLPRSRSSDGALEIARLVLLELPDRTVDLFRTVPSAWVGDRSLLERASLLWQALPLPWQELFNGVLWAHHRFERFCTGPGSIRGHHSERNGNLRHMVETGEAVRALLPAHPAAHADIALAAAMLHDVAKADEYRPTAAGWAMSDAGRLAGHKQTIGDWIAVAESRMRLKLPSEHYLSLRHAIGAAARVPFESGYRQPCTPEARLLSLADQSSGAGDLYARQASNDGGWGIPHPHLGNVVPYFVTDGMPGTGG